MSFNRGMKRSFGNDRGMNRSGGGGNSVGGMGVGSSGNRGVSPWESGVMPPGRGILPTPNNSLSLNSPQAQLVIASNLLSNLLRNQQDSSPQVPSLLSLNNLNGPSSNFRGQQGFSSQGRFNDRAVSRGINMKSQRSQPYKMGNRARDGVRRGPSSQQSRAQSGNQRSNGNQNQHRNDKNSKANNAKNQSSKKQEQQDTKNDKEKPITETIVNSEKASEKDDKKSEDKANDDESAMDTETEKKTDEDKESADQSGSPKKDDGSGKKSEARHAESRYAAVAMKDMFCHVCNKHMWDGFSFERHIRGRAHQLMMDKLDESYKMKVDLMRYDLRVSEEQREISLNNSKRRGKKLDVDLNVREYCTMCNLNFYGTLSNHRKSEKHQQLKTFLHPRCQACVKEFPSRIEYDEHCLTPVHMVKVADIEAAKKTKSKKLPKGESEIRSAEDEDKDCVSDSKATGKEDEIGDNVEIVKDITEDMDLTKVKIPPYRYCRSKQIGLGESLVKEVTGFHCEKCRRFMLTPEDKAAHLKTLTHYRNFVNEIKALVAAAAPAPEAAEESQEGDDEDTVKKEQDESPVKRRKVDDESLANDDTTEDVAPVKDEEVADQSEAADVQTEEDGDKYDPIEADAQSEKDEPEVESMKELAEESMKDDNAEKVEEKADDAWEDIDEDESEVGNLIDGDDKADPVPETPQAKPQPQCTSTPAPVKASAKASAPATPAKAPANQATPAKAPVTQSTPAKAPATPTKAPVTQATPVKTPTTPTPPDPPIISQSPSNNSSNFQNNLNNSGNKNNRGGRGFRGNTNRGHQRARRSRR